MQYFLSMAWDLNPLNPSLSCFYGQEFMNQPSIYAFAYF
jgi:hypothetical protein